MGKELKKLKTELAEYENQRDKFSIDLKSTMTKLERERSANAELKEQVKNK